MAHLHLQLLAHRFNDLTDDYLRRVNWLVSEAVGPVDDLQRSIDAICNKQRFQSCRSLVFDDVNFGKEILHFLSPVDCCGRTLWHTDTLMLHLLSDKNHADDRVDDATKRLVIMFNLYVVMLNHVLVRYDNNFEKVDQMTVDLLRKGHGYLNCILRKPIRSDAISTGTFIHTNFKKWKYVFDYTCGPCCDEGYDQCRFCESIAWFKIHSSSLTVNPIRHLESLMHAETIRGLPKDRIVADELEINNNLQWSSAAVYLLHVREMELDKMVATGLEIELSTPYDKIVAYLTLHLSRALGGIMVTSFGSRVTGVANRESDIDLLVKSRSGQKEKTALTKAIAWAESNKPDVQVKRKILEDPFLVRIYVASLNATLDISFGSSYVVANSKLIKCFFQHQPISRKLFFLLKEWKQQTQISQNFHHHFLTMLIIFYMQHRDYLPHIRSLIIGDVVQNNKYNTNFRDNFQVMLKPRDLLGLAKDFFSYWAKFDWTRYGISVFDGQVKVKESFRFSLGRQSIPPIMASDYFNQSRNCGSNIGVGDYQKFVVACKEAVNVLKVKHAM